MCKFRGNHKHATELAAQNAGNIYYENTMHAHAFRLVDAQVAEEWS